MAAPFPSTAEQVVAAVEAVAVNARETDDGFVSAFADLPMDRASAALALAADLGLLSRSGAGYVANSPLCRFCAAALQQRAAAALRIALESYEPFLVFRERLGFTTDGSVAARHVKTKLSLDGHHDEIRDTLVSLGTYSHALRSVGSGQYEIPSDLAENDLETAVRACEDIASATARVKEQLGERATEKSSESEVITPLADALLRGKRNDPEGAVQQAGNAVEAYLVDVAQRRQVSLQGRNGLNAKLEAIADSESLPQKLRRISKFVGDIRNAADHGPDPDVGNVSWEIRDNTGLEYVFVACSFLASLAAWEDGEPPAV